MVRAPLLPVAEALSRIRGAMQPVAAETVALPDAHGRILAAPVLSRRTQPPFAMSAMDGYAVRAADLASIPATLKLIGQAPAGTAFEGIVGPGEAVRIFTGGPVPQGADTIVIQENTEGDGDKVTVLKAAEPGVYIRPEGLDFREGDCLLQAGKRLGAR
ncbi:MAG TPA: molybdopterin molybdenumtransferase MoeA, partial [Alphaproteobacteria bacterium]|nr:molybdopterin molybdenumtransferase MoeA [Alphaproteobacteria bacterium]